MSSKTEVVIVGGGLAGLAAAAFLARGGRQVVLLERAASVGGRAATHKKGGFSLNLGPHALYFGAGREVLTELGVPFEGKKPPVSGLGYEGGTLHTLPAGFLSLIATDLLDLGGKFETAKLLSRVQSIPTDGLEAVSVEKWLDGHTRDPGVRRLIEALIRVATYTDDPARLSASLALWQIKTALSKSVTYLDGGWQTLADALAVIAVKAGAIIRTHASVSAILHDERVRGVRLADGDEIAARQVILAGTPQMAHHLVPDSPSLARAASAPTIEAACLDLALSALPKPRNLFALGIDCPLYLSVHSATAKLAEPGSAVIHVAKYLRPGVATDPHEDERELEALTDQAQPGWRDLVVERRYLPRMAVYHYLPTAESGGLPGRISPTVAEIAGLLVAGDWVGPVGLLADASLASARAAAMAILDEKSSAARHSGAKETRGASASA
jgi:phytoene dehydrogenase-like protein